MCFVCFSVNSFGFLRPDFCQKWPPAHRRTSESQLCVGYRCDIENRSTACILTLSAGILVSGWSFSCWVWGHCCPGTSSWLLQWYDVTSCVFFSVCVWWDLLWTTKSTLVLPKTGNRTMSWWGGRHEGDVLQRDSLGGCWGMILDGECV